MADWDKEGYDYWPQRLAPEPWPRHVHEDNDQGICVKCGAPSDHPVHFQSENH